MAKHRVLGVSFDHMHMGDLLRQVAEHPDAEIVAVFDPDRQRMQAAVAAFGIPDETGLHRSRRLPRRHAARILRSSARPPPSMPGPSSGWRRTGST